MEKSGIRCTRCGEDIIYSASHKCTPKRAKTYIKTKRESEEAISDFRCGGY